MRLLLIFVPLVHNDTCYPALLVIGQFLDALNSGKYDLEHTADVYKRQFSAQCGPVHIGIDAGSTTVKLVVVDEQSQILYTNYQPNLGNPLPLIREQLLKLYKEHPGLKVASVTTTGYGEELVKNAFRCDYGLVETVAHFTAAKYRCV